MTTQTLREPIEPLHWRGDRGTLDAFNAAFVKLMGTKDIGPINGQPAGLPADEMEQLRQFLLDTRLPPNPYRNTDDTLPNTVIQVPGEPVSGNPVAGETVFRTLNIESNPTHCTGCHASDQGTSGGKIGGIQPTDPPSARAALVNGIKVQSIHSDIKVPHLRNLYEKIGPIFGSFSSPPDRKTGFGFRHEGSISDLATFLSSRIFLLTAQQVKDVSTFVFHFPTGQKPSVGKMVTVPAGTPPTGSSSEESLLSLLIQLGDGSDAARHCELTATTVLGGRLRAYRLASGTWSGDVSAESPLSILTLRQMAQGPLTFVCAPLASGIRLGGNRDEDAALDGDDCNPADSGAWNTPDLVSGVTETRTGGATLAWQDQAPASGPGVMYDVLSGGLQALKSQGPSSASCLAGGVATPSYVDSRADPSPGDGFYYLIRARNSCGSGGYGPGLESLDTLSCSGP